MGEKRPEPEPRAVMMRRDLVAVFVSRPPSTETGEMRENAGAKFHNQALSTSLRSQVHHRGVI